MLCLRSLKPVCSYDAWQGSQPSYEHEYWKGIYIDMCCKEEKTHKLDDRQGLWWLCSCWQKLRAPLSRILFSLRTFFCQKNFLFYRLSPKLQSSLLKWHFSRSRICWRTRMKSFKSLPIKLKCSSFLNTLRRKSKMCSKLEQCQILYLAWIFMFEVAFISLWRKSWNRGFLMTKWKLW